MEGAYVRSPEQVLKHFNVSERLGLSQAQVKTAREKYGRNGM